MADTFNSRIKNKKDTEANWRNRNPVLLDGEIILVATDNGDIKLKIGDGTSAYTSLPFLNFGFASTEADM